VSITEIFETMEYGPAPESREIADVWLDGHGREFGSYIGGSLRKSSVFFETLNPANGKPIAKVSQAGVEEINAAVSAATEAQKKWAKLSGFERAKYLYAIARQIQKHSRLFAVLETLDNGKPIRETRDIDIPLVARHFYYHAGWAKLMPSELEGYEPVGVCGQIIPWNFPLLMLAWKIAPALAMGNAVILKPAEYTPLTALLFAEICHQVGLPPGVANIVTGDGATGKLIVEHPGIQKIAFTGSTEVGRILRQATAGTGKKLSLELGGKSPFVVFEDADLDSAVEGLVDAIWFNQGQVCCAGSRLLVQEGIAEKALTKIQHRMENLRVGDPLDKAVDIGAIIAPVQLERINQLVNQGCEEGASLFQPTWACPKEGWFYPPTLLSNVSPSSTVAQVEIFGPVLVSMTFRTPAEAVALANNTTYGLAASVWSENVNLCLDVASKIKAGTVWVNCTNMFDAASGFGGYRESGYGREGGKEGLYEYVKPIQKSSPTVHSPKAVHSSQFTVHSVDRTHKQYIGGKQVRPDSGYSITLDLADGSKEEVARGNRKDVRNAVEAAKAAQPGWASTTGHARAQILYYLAENLSGIAEEMKQAVIRSGGNEHEVEASIERCFSYAAWADKFEGQVHGTPFRGLTYTLNEPVGVIGIVCGEHAPLLGFMSLLLPAVAMGNTVIVIPSENGPLPAVELYRVIEVSDVPGGVINILTGLHSEMETILAEHDGVDAIWHFGSAEARAKAEKLSVGNLKQIWAPEPPDWTDAHAEGEYFLRHATQVKNIWVPFGE
jgi:aldehyde dehydrogenase (NAD+)